MKDKDLFVLLLITILVVLAYNYYDKVVAQNFYFLTDAPTEE